MRREVLSVGSTAGRVGVGCGVRERQSWVGQGAEKAHLMTKQHFDFYENI